MVRQGSGGCIFLSDKSGSDIASFEYPGWSKVRSYTDPRVPNTKQGIVITAGAKCLLAGYAETSTTLAAIGVWRRGPHCTLSRLGTYPVPEAIVTKGFSPDGKTLMVSY